MIKINWYQYFVITDEITLEINVFVCNRHGYGHPVTPVYHGTPTPATIHAVSPTPVPRDPPLLRDGPFLRDPLLGDGPFFLDGAKK